MPNVRDDDEEGLEFADESEYMDYDEDREADEAIDSLTASIQKLAETDYVTASELAATIRRLDLGTFAVRLERWAAAIA